MKRFNYYYGKRVTGFTKLVIFILAMFFTAVSGLPAMQTASVLAAVGCWVQVLTIGSSKARKAAFVAIGVIALSLSFPWLSSMLKVGAVFAALTLTKGRSTRWLAYGVAILVALTFFFAPLDVLAKVIAALAVYGAAGAYDDTLADKRREHTKEP